MDHVVFMIFRRMRAPLLWLIGSYAVSVLGLVLIPGQDAQGQPWQMGFFHALYFVSYTATTIGFGEIPYAFTDAQRLWVMLSIYVTVIVWIYAIGTLLALLQDRTFQQALTELRFARRVRRLRERFYLVCGYGETGGALVQALTDRDQHAVVIDIREERVNALKLENLRQYVPGLCGDAGRPLHLLEAGLRHERCAGVVAITNVNETNLKIALTAKLLHPGATVICRADAHEVEANMASFGTDHIYDPFDTFALHLATALQAPCLHLLHEWLSGTAGQCLAEPVHPPREGLWILCGYGRFGKAVYRRLRDEGLEVVVIEATPGRTGVPPDGRVVVGRGTEAVTLEEADIQRARGLVAGTDDDVNNLSIIMTARALCPDLFIVARQNQLDNQELFDALGAAMVMHPSAIVANKIRVLLATPLLSVLERLVLFQDDAWACQLVSRIAALVQDRVPEVWELTLDDAQAHAVLLALGRGARVTLGELLRDPRERGRTLPCIPLLLLREPTRDLLPGEATALHPGDRLLFCGRESARRAMEWTLLNLYALDYVQGGEGRPQGWAWRVLGRTLGRTLGHTLGRTLGRLLERVRSRRR